MAGKLLLLVPARPGGAGSALCSLPLRVTPAPASVDTARGLVLCRCPESRPRSATSKENQGQSWSPFPMGGSGLVCAAASADAVGVCWAPRAPRDSLVLWCWSVLPLGRVFPDGPRAGWSVIFSCLAVGFTGKQENSWAETLEEQQKQKDSGSCENPRREPPKRCPRCPNIPGWAVTVTWLCSDTGQLSSPKEQLGHVCPKNSLVELFFAGSKEGAASGVGTPAPQKHQHEPVLEDSAEHTPASSSC